MEPVPTGGLASGQLPGTEARGDTSGRVSWPQVPAPPVELRGESSTGSVDTANYIGVQAHNSENILVTLS